MKRIPSISISLAMMISMSTSFALPLSAEMIQETTSEAVTTAPEEFPVIPEATDTLSEATDMMQGVTESTSEVMEVTDHASDESVVTEEPTFAAGNVVASGTCGSEGDGTNLSWTLDSEGTLTISGSGEMGDYNNGISPFSYRDRIKSAVLMLGVTSIGDNALIIAPA